MDKGQIKILDMHLKGHTLYIDLSIKCSFNPDVRNPQVVVVFTNGVETRRLPVPVQDYHPEEDLKECRIFSKYKYLVNRLFFEANTDEEIHFWFEFLYGDIVVDHMPICIDKDVDMTSFSCIGSDVLVLNGERAENQDGLGKGHVKRKRSRKKSWYLKVVKGIWTCFLIMLAIVLFPIFLIEGILVLLHCADPNPKNKKKGLKKLRAHLWWRINIFTCLKLRTVESKTALLQRFFFLFSKMKIHKNRIAFISNRRNDLTGNFEFVHNLLKDNSNLDIRFLLDCRKPKKISYWNFLLFGYYCATSKVILVDDFNALLGKIPRRKGTILIQLWHACGAFKIFGFSRLGKEEEPSQKSQAHRGYDYAIVSSKEISKFYAEGFGISLEKVVATGIPRTDIFFSHSYKENVRDKFYQSQPKLKDKKILLFAPTFRGSGKGSAFYPSDKFDAVRMYEELQGEYAIIIKHHPFVKMKDNIPEEYKEYILNLSAQSELNDLLFVADLLVTDYSSVIFEASLLNIPMLFYSFDLQNYISSRGFYYEYETFVPGKIVRSFSEMMTAIQERDFEAEKLKQFKTRFFDDLDGKSSERVVKLIYDTIQNK